jgi:hypothetical protein
MTAFKHVRAATGSWEIGSESNPHPYFPRVNFQRQIPTNPRPPRAKNAVKYHNIPHIAPLCPEVGGGGGGGGGGIRQLINILFCGYRSDIHDPLSEKNASRNLYSSGAQVPQRVIS